MGNFILDNRQLITNIAPVVIPLADNCWVCGDYAEIIAIDRKISNSWLCGECVDDAVVCDLLAQIHWGDKIKKR